MRNQKESNNKSTSSDKFDSIIDEIKQMRFDFIKENISELKRNIKVNYKKLRISALSLVEYNFHENSHSNILEYLIDYNSYEKGADILCQLVKDTVCLDYEKLCKKILKKSYTVFREYTVPSGRIDLLILDKIEKFIIIIENKILADIGSKIIIEEENTLTQSQLQIYEKWSKSDYPNYDHLYVLLHLSNNDEDIFAFLKVSYEQLYQNLKTNQIEDNIIDDYLLLLETIVNPTTHDLFYYKKLATKLLKNEKTNLSLVDYYKLKNIFYAK